MLEIGVRARFGDFSLAARLDVPVGVTALLGPSGAGKSSLLRLVAGLSQPQAGRIVLGGRVLCDVATGTFLRPEKRRIGMVFQRAALVPHLDVMANVAIGANGRPVAADILESTGVSRLLSRPVAALSGGERQRIMLARALAGQPGMLLFDEPLSALDPVARADLLAVFAKLIPALGVPVLYVTHAMEEAGQVAQRFALIRDGGIDVQGDATAVLSRYGPAGEGGIAGVLRGRVTRIAEDGLAIIDTGGQNVEATGRALTVGDEVLLRVSARDVVLARNAPADISARNALDGRIAGLRALPGGQVAISIAIGKQSLLAIVMARTVRDMDLAPGQPIVAIFKSAAVESLR